MPCMIFFILLAIQTLLSIYIIFWGKFSPADTRAWIIAVLLIPIFGVLFFCLFGMRTHFRKTSALQFKTSFGGFFQNILNKQIEQLSIAQTADDKYLDLLRMNLQTADAIYYDYNQIATYPCGIEKFEQLKKDIADAKNHIHILYYIIKPHQITGELLTLLVEKARQGVEVKIIYDPWGSKKMVLAYFKPLLEAGGEARAFNPVWRYPLLANYRNHRKIVVIDGKIGYTGGMNISRDYINEGKIVPWRDTHLRILGPALQYLQLRFLMDWAYCARKSLPVNKTVFDNYFPFISSNGTAKIQFVCSGPDKEEQPTRRALLKMINLAKDSILIETPYFIPDSELVEALKIAAYSGVRIEIILPGKCDHYPVFCAGSTFLADLMESGILFYYYNGFIHAKSVVIDDALSCIGSTNWDHRSFLYDFEINTLVCDKDFADTQRTVFIQDRANSRGLSLEDIKNRPIKEKIIGRLMRLLSPLL